LHYGLKLGRFRALLAGIVFVRISNWCFSWYSISSSRSNWRNNTLKPRRGAHPNRPRRVCCRFVGASGLGGWLNSASPAFHGRQKEIAHEIGVSEQVLSNWLNGSRRPSLDSFFKIRDRLGARRGE
jgi:hypothetical protein